VNRQLCIGARCRRRDDGPRLAAPELLLCYACRDRISVCAFEAGRVYEALGSVLARAGRASERVSGSRGSVGLAIDPLVADERNTIRVVLVGWCQVVVQKRPAHPPQDTNVSLAMFLRTHADWIARQYWAGDVSAELDDAAWNSARRRLAFPSGPGVFIGECPLHVAREGGLEVCGTRLTVRPDDDGIVTCRGCGATETIEEWQRRIVGDLGTTASAVEVAALLSWRWKRPVDRDTVRQWWRDGKVDRVTGADGEPVLDGRRRPVYSVAQCLGYARALWGPSTVRVGA
jgi:hypothetical protein